VSLLEIRSHFLNDHASLRGKVFVLRSLALSILRGDDELMSALLLKGKDLRDQLHRHLSWEEEHVLPMLHHWSPLGAQTAAELLGEHETQRVRLDESLNSLDAVDFAPKQLARSIMNLISWIEGDMKSEEETILAFIMIDAEAEVPRGASRSAGSECQPRSAIKSAARRD
jgi:hypothetical protein